MIYSSWRQPHSINLLTDWSILNGEYNAITIPEPGPSPTPLPGDRDAHVRIIAALVNPAGEEPDHETVTLINTTPTDIHLDGWVIVDRNKKRSALHNTLLKSGKTVCIELDGKGVQLGNHGGVISLLDENGIKNDGVSYSREEARKQGWSLVFTA